MTVPPDDRADQGSEPVAQPEPLDFDPYRFGRPDHPIPPEYAPPGYYPEPSAAPPTQPGPYGAPVWPPQSAPGAPGYQQYAQYPQYPPPPYPQQPYQGYPPPPPHAPYGATRAGNTKATVALVLGILSILLAWLTLWDLLLIVPAIVIGTTARNDAKRFPERGGRGMATAGLICGIVGGLIAVLATVYIYSKVKSCLDEYGPTSSQFQTCATNKLTDG